MIATTTRLRITRGRFQWLRAQSDRWTAEGLIDQAARDRILESYDTDALQRQGMLAVVLLAALMCALGLLLLIGYNWTLIPRVAKLAIVSGVVAAAYAASAFAYARRHPVAGEVLAFAGTLLFGNAIVLTGQVLHMSDGFFPDAVLWFALAVLATAVLVESRWIGVEAAAALFVWTVVQGSAAAGPLYAFIALWPVMLAAAYALRSPLMVLVLVLDAGFWMFMSGIDMSRSPAWLGSVSLGACALYGVGRWQAGDTNMRWAWQGGGLVVLCLALLPLMALPVQQTLGATESARFSATLAAISAIAAGLLLARGSRGAADRAVLAAAAAVVVWIAAVWSGVPGGAAVVARVGTVLFSVLALGVAVSLIRDALDTGGLRELALGILFAAAFLVIRWTSVVENLFWSGLLLLASGGGLLLVARLWRTRRGAEGRAS